MIHECGNCKYWESGENGKEIGICHRYAPRPDEGDKNAVHNFAYWPLTYIDDWCGEFKSREAEDEC